MDAWGTGVYENQRACDLAKRLNTVDIEDKDACFDITLKNFRRYYKSYPKDHPEEIRVIADVFIHLANSGYLIPTGVFWEVEETYLRGVFKNKEWKNSWNKKNINAVIGIEYNNLVNTLKNNWNNVDVDKRKLRTKDLPDHVNF